jgi:hypothetical protein
LPLNVSFSLGCPDEAGVPAPETAVVDKPSAADEPGSSKSASSG